MKIAINVWLLRKRELDGIGEFIKETMSRIIADHPDVEFLILCDRGFKADYFDFPNARKYYIFPALRHPVLYVFFMELVVRFFLKRHKPDLLVAPEGMLSLGSNCKQLPVIHDLNFIHQPENLNFRNRVYNNFFIRRFARKAVRIATVSEFTKKDIVASFHLPPDLIDVVYCGIKPILKPLPQSELQLTRNKFSDGKEYFFFVGSLHPRKNILRLMQAFDLFKKETKSEMKLVLAGSIMWDDKDIKACSDTLTYKSDIVFTGHVSDDDLNRLYCAAMALSFVPIFEGFGIPIIEAFAAQVPVICSNVTSMPEIAGDAALLVDPYDIEDIKNAMVKIYKNEDDLRIKLIEKGNIRKQLFSWDQTANLFWSSIMKILS